MNSNLVIVVLGPTSTGKSDLAVKIALKYNGEIISADSRQIYKGLDIGSGKITKEEMLGIPHHGLDLVDPATRYSMADFQEYAFQKIKEIKGRGNIPILCGGTGFFIQSVVDNLKLPDVPPNETLRKELEGKSAEELFQILKQKDSQKAATIDSQNPHRLIRAIEIAEALGKVPPVSKQSTPYEFLQIGLFLPKDEIQEKIKNRLLKRIDQGMIEEVENLHANRLSWKRLEELGLEYRHVAEFLQNKISKEEMIEILINKINQYAKRQITWFKRDERIHWFKPDQEQEIFKCIQTKEKERD